MNKIELLAPGGDIGSIKAAILAGADAIYCGLDVFNARQRATNINFDSLMGILGLAHRYDCKIFLTLNVILTDAELYRLIELLNKLNNTSIDGIIVQDFGLLYLLSKYFKDLELHASTQLTTHNKGQIEFLKKIGITRVNLSRELSISEIKYLTEISHENNIETEVFIHGSNCISFSGICYFSSVTNGNSGNRGVCSQPCRAQYLKTAKAKNHPFNIKDKSAFHDLKELYNVNVDSLKIEGRIKKYHYVYTVVDTWRKHLEHFYKYNTLNQDDSDLYKVFNRGFSNTFLKGEISKDMFTDAPRDNSAKYFSEKNNITIEQAKKELHNIKTKIIQTVKDKIDNLNTDKTPVFIEIEGKFNDFLKIYVKKASNSSFEIISKTKLNNKGKYILNNEFFREKFDILNNYEYHIEDINLDKLDDNLFISFKDLKSMRNEILYLLNDARNTIKYVELPKLKKLKRAKINPFLSILISSEKDLDIYKSNKELYFKIPDSLEAGYSKYLDIFLNNKNLIPWFPSVIIGDDYSLAVKFLNDIKPKLIVTNNTGIAYEAYKRNINWIAGPYLNTINSFSLFSLKENFNCSGAFISNELSKKQIRKINSPEDFKLYYSIYHPILLLTTRQCLFHQITGCEKSIMNNECIKACKKNSEVSTLKGTKLFVKKLKGNYHRIYNDDNFLNTEIINDLDSSFSCFFIDLSDIDTNTKLKASKTYIAKVFKKAITGDKESIKNIKENIKNTTSAQYERGV